MSEASSRSTEQAASASAAASPAEASPPTDVGQVPSNTSAVAGATGIATSSVNGAAPLPSSTTAATPAAAAAPISADAPAKTPADPRQSDGAGNSSSDPPSIQFNPISKWEEPIEVVGLTQWDIHCKLRHIQNEDDPNARIRVSVKQLSTEMTCPVCLGFFNKPVTVMECLHRFCAECIEKCLRIGKKECPSCRIHIPSRRSLRNDNNFEELMRSIYGDVETLQRQEAKEIELLNRTQNMHNSAERSRTVGIIQQQKSRGKKRSEIEDEQTRTVNGTISSITGPSALAPGSSRDKRLRHGSSSISAVSSAQHPPLKIHGLERSALLGYYLQRHPQERRVDRLDKELLRTSKEMTICSLKKFLGAKLRHAPASDFQISCSIGGKQTVLEDTMTVGLVHEQISDLDVGAILVLQYRLNATI